MRSGRAYDRRDEHRVFEASAGGEIEVAELLFTSWLAQHKTASVSSIVIHCSRLSSVVIARADGDDIGHPVTLVRAAATSILTMHEARADEARGEGSLPGVE